MHSTVLSTDAISKITLTTDSSYLQTRPSDIYGGSFQVKVESGTQERLDFFLTLVSNKIGCSHSKCYFGWVNNYTISGQQSVIGYGNPDLKIQPVFEFRANSNKDFLIVRDPNLSQEWVQIIEIYC